MMHRISSTALLLVLAFAATTLSAQEIVLNMKIGMGDGHDSITVNDVLSTELALIHVVTTDSVWPTTDYAVAPPGCWGQTVINPVKVPGRMRMLQRFNGVDSLLYDTGDYVEKTSGMTIRIRGNSSAWYYDKKPYKIKLQKKGDLLLRNRPELNDKDWLLIKDEQLKAMQAFEVSRMLGMKWTPGYTYVNLIINDRYEGMYMLVESVKRNTTARLNTAKEGFIFECDPYYWKEDFSVPSLLCQQMQFTLKYPDDPLVTMTEEDVNYFTTMCNDMERSYGEDYADVIDYSSFARWSLVHDIVGTKDDAGANEYFMKCDRDEGTLIEKPVVWDFDSAEQTPDMWSGLHSYNTSHLWNNVDRSFVNSYIEQWLAVTDSIYIKLYNRFMAFKLSKTGKGLTASYKLENKRWDTAYWTLQYFYNRPSWIKKRKAWLDTAIEQLNPRGDVNIDAVVDDTDLDLIMAMLLEQQPVKFARTADLDSNGKVDVCDLVGVLRGKYKQDHATDSVPVELPAEQISHNTKPAVASAVIAVNEDIPIVLHPRTGRDVTLYLDNNDFNFTALQLDVNVEGSEAGNVVLNSVVLADSIRGSHNLLIDTIPAKGGKRVVIWSKELERSVQPELLTLNVSFVPHDTISTDSVCLMPAKIVISNVRMAGIDMALRLVGGVELQVTDYDHYDPDSFAKGDVNHDRRVNVSDVNVLVDAIMAKDLAGLFMTEADVNADGVINVCDITAVIDIINGRYQVSSDGRKAAHVAL